MLFFLVLSVHINLPVALKLHIPQAQHTDNGHCYSYLCSCNWPIRRHVVTTQRVMDINDLNDTN